jgi:hypothetical protein
MPPPPPCEIKEAGMTVYGLADLSVGRAGVDYPSGVVVENYQVSTAPDAEGVYRNLPAPTPELKDFFGVRVTFCATGDFFAIRDTGIDEAVYGLRATEFVRPDFLAQKPIKISALTRAVQALFGQRAITLRETAETCGCYTAYPELRPDGMTPFRERKDVEARP